MTLCSLSAVLTLILCSEVGEASGPLQGWHGWDGVWRAGHPRANKFGKRLEHNLISLIFKTKPNLFVVKRFLSLRWWYRAAWQKKIMQNCGLECVTVHVTACVCSLQ